MYLPFLVCAAGTLVLSWGLVGRLIGWAPRLGLLDRPNARSSHQRVTPRGGGIGFVVAISLGLAAGLLGGGCGGTLGALVPEAVLAPAQLWAVLGAALFIAAISLRDDLKSLGAGVRFACHFAAAGAAIWVLGPFLTVGLPLGGEWALGMGLGTGLTLVWIVGLTNVYNFMDGIDGIAGVQGVVAGLGWAVAGVANGAATTALLGVVLAAGCAGFLRYNWSPARIFMGDVGSAFLGFWFAVVPLVAAREVPGLAAAWPVFAGLVVWPFVGDGFLTFVRRALKREKVWEAHRSHLYQRLVQTGWSHARVSAVYAVWAVVAVACAGLWLGDGCIGDWVTLVVPLASLAGFFAWVSRREAAVRP